MRELEVLRVESDGQYVVCIDRETDEHFRIRADDDLRAAARADTTELGQIPVSGDAALRPREIQSRIRAGASVDELAQIAGVSVSKIERYAHPVLLERARAAELARASHPMDMDGPNPATLGELVAECLVLRGEVPADARWDSWKADDGDWVVQVSFYEGPDEQFAHWRFLPGSYGGTTDPIDELAVELTDPALSRAARRTRLAAVPAEPRREFRPDGHQEVTVDADSLIDAQQSRPPERPRPPLADILDLQYSTAPAAEAYDNLRTADEEHESGDGATADERSGASRHRAKRAKPAVPAWEDVLLGVRSHDD